MEEQSFTFKVALEVWVKMESLWQKVIPEKYNLGRKVLMFHLVMTKEGIWSRIMLDIVNVLKKIHCWLRD